MQTKEVADFFNKLAPTWDDTNVQSEDVLSSIIESLNLTCGTSVLDVGCGTGVLFPYFQKCGAAICGIDISSEMIKIAEAKYPDADLICADAESYQFDKTFDRIVLFNCFPHFINPAGLFANLCKYLAPGGRLTIAHGASRSEINECHKNVLNVSNELPPAGELAELLSEYLQVDTIIDNDKMYLVSGRK